MDFSYSVNGETYEYSLAGGGFITLRQLAEALNIIEDTPFESVDEFVSYIDKVEFSSPSLAWVGKAEEDCTVGQLKFDLGLVVEYSGELTEERIEEINSAPISSGEWLLISLKPFASRESLTVTMKNGDVIIIVVTDAQHITDLSRLLFVRENIMTFTYSSKRMTYISLWIRMIG